ncbi:hypothetical protein M441DRAFT_24195 [Trichoderma asperellum CBS 433.97]|uniref:EGF-like domain-containing protein n=1 Tax=Trichoderma asperellum (strain ATCC 204424 / CBS 433.97 / NBRC 101777) TaxID=1042311 RepID=A0A2T3ZGK9_TRIA4|nr:hypothetical protein M441DRAFT_24195 [Trichoderma asperellum CBS 433.97]PTB43945.1 hypothetical protein M441DRAFT_24195 [Trichoderma asperellum CBS 433.97]
MSQAYNGGRDWPAQSPPSSQRPRDRAQVGFPFSSESNRREQRLRHNPNPSYDTPPQDEVSPPNSTRSRAANGQNGNMAPTISRPSPAPQWPLQSPDAAAPPDADSYRPPPDRPRVAPQRPPRPSQVPSLVDQSRPQQPTPIFRVPGEPASPSEVESPVSETSERPRRSANLGPPPSSRRGQSSFYSATSFVSPIPEEHSAYTSHNSYASSAAMPDAWRAESAGTSPGFHGGGFYEESLTERSRNSGSEDYSDESGLVSGQDEYALQTLSSPHSRGKKPASPNPFNDGTGLIDEFTTDSTPNTFSNKQAPAAAPGVVNHIAAVRLSQSGTMSPADLRRAAGSPPPTSRLSAIRRPPRLDIDAVREAESRGSLTSLPDLIRRATRLASMIDKGKRPSSRLDELDFFNEKASSGSGVKRSFDDRYQSGLSDMLAAFPPPVQTPVHTHRPTNAWPSVPGGTYTGREKFMMTPDDQEVPANSNAKPKARRCCGLPVWAFILIIFLMLCIIATAIVIPLEYFVFKNLGNSANKSTTVNLQSCAKSLPCLNGGSGVVINGTCSCICTNGFTGANCGTNGSSGCTTTNLIPTDGSAHINNVTLGMAIPRIIADSGKNFSIPLLGTEILARFNTGNLSCIAQNALVTFDGQSTRTGVANAQVQSTSDNAQDATAKDSGPTPDLTSRDLRAVEGQVPSRVRRSSPSSSSSSSSPEQTSMFTVTQQVLDFARTAVLYVLQEDSIEAANTAQTQLQQFFTQASQAITKYGSVVTVQQASSISIGGNRTVDLVDATVDIGQGPVGGKKTSKRGLLFGF